MPLMAEELVEEWLNRQGYFTIRGARVSVHEIDLLAIRPTESGLECRHVEVQVSVRPMSYIGRLSKEDQASSGRAATSAAKRNVDQLSVGIEAWYEKKFALKEKGTLRSRLVPSTATWSHELVVHNVKEKLELELLAAKGVKITPFLEVLRSLASIKGSAVERACGNDFLELVMLGKLLHTDLS